MKKTVKLITALFIVVMLVGGAAQAQEMKFWRIGTGSAGGTYFPIGGLIANAISNPPGSRPCDKGGNCGVPGLVAIAQSTNASVANCTAIQNGQMEAGLTGAQTAYEAFTGSPKFKGKKYDKLRLLANLFPEDLQLVLPKGAKLNSIQDLKGKRVGIAQAGSGTQNTVVAFLEAAGITRDDISEAELNNTQSAQRIADGQLDAYFYAAGTPTAAMIQLDSTRGMELYSFSDAERDLIHKVAPFYVLSVIPANTYEGIKYDVKTNAVNAQFVTNIDQPEELVYQITKALWNESTRRLLDNGHAKGKVITLDTALVSVLIPLHPGAERFYKEKGMIK